MFRGNPRLLAATLPWVVVVVVLKLVVEIADWHVFDLSPLLAGAIGAEVFILGFLLSGTAGDFKEAERLPGELAAAPRDHRGRVPDHRQGVPPPRGAGLPEHPGRDQPLGPARG